ncbi:glutaredoxin domain-containing protein [Pseudoalteromonas spongiae]|uniref:glutaredoxin domain-containing protein n=1 Tax=Pseudoalteromonas spongiae TaxID=298657 RepID=UPI00110B7A40|nr:glutaredoxin domain-containing protein [Pseudoalteromonas spongiae]TMO84856.1 glutaredoxin [Pseudoalteromonas spongiae]
MSKTKIYAKDYCPYCKTAKSLMDGLNWQYEEIDVTYNSHEFKQMVLLSGRKTVPQIFIDGEHIGGCDNFKAYLTKHAL